MMILNRNSWHGRLATVYGDLKIFNDEQVTICQYVSCMIHGLCMVFFIIIAGCAFGGMLGDTLAWCAAMLTTGSYVKPSEVAMIWPALILCVVCLILLVLGAAACSKIKIWFKIRAAQASAEPETVGPVTAWYRSFKEKTCFYITLR